MVKYVAGVVMNIRKRVLIIVSIMIALAIVAIPSWFLYVSKFERTELCRYTGPDEEYNVILYEIGDASWPFGPVKAQLKVVDQKGKKITERDFWVYNDGGNLDTKNITSVVWLDSRIEVTIRHFDGAPKTTYWLPLPVD